MKSRAAKCLECAGRCLGPRVLNEISDAGARYLNNKHDEFLQGQESEQKAGNGPNSIESAAACLFL